MAGPQNLYSQVHDRVVNGEFEPRQRLKPEVLAKHHGCSASAIREVLFRLSTVGLVDFQEQRGFRLPAISAEVRHDLTKFRILLECEGACLSIRNGGLEWEARLSAAHHKLSHIERSVGNADERASLIPLWTAAELDFHQTLISACGSQTLQHTHAIVYQQFRQQLINTDMEFVFVEENIDQHQAILDAALAHDEAGIRDKITVHLSRSLNEHANA